MSLQTPLFFEFSDYQYFDGRIKYNNILNECSHQGVKISIETSMAEIKPVVLKKIDFERRDDSLLVALSEISDFHDSDAERISIDFFLKTSLQEWILVET